MRWLENMAVGRRILCFAAACLLGILCLLGSGCSSKRPYILQDISIQLDQAVTEAILQHNKGLRADCEFPTESHALLGAEKQDNITIVYAMVMYREYAFRYGGVKLLGDTYMPVAMTFEQQPDGQYRLAEYWEPPAGEGYESAIENKFPRPLYEKAINLQQYFDQLVWDCDLKAKDYFASNQS